MKKMFSFVFRFFLWLFGWQELEPQTQIQLTKISQGIFIYPHTSKWDSVIFGFYFCAFPTLFANTFTLFAARFFVCPLHFLLKRCHCIPIENTKRAQGQFQPLLTFLQSKKNFQLFMSPKGSSENRPWRTGYLRLSEALKCPIVVCGLDYKRKVPVITGIFELGSEKEFQERMKLIPSLYPKNEPSVFCT